MTLRCRQALLLGALTSALAVSSVSLVSLVWAAAQDVAPPMRDPRLLLDATRAGDTLVAVGEWGAVLVSVDRGVHWRAVQVPTEETLTAVRFVDAKNGWAVGHHGTILTTRDGANTWELRSVDPASTEPLLGIAFVDANNGFAVGTFGMLLQSVDGVRFSSRDIGQGDRHLKAVAADPSGLVVIASEEGTVFCSTDRGATFRPTRTGYAGSFWGALAMPGTAMVYGMRGHVFRSDDGCRTWAEVPTGTTAGLSTAAVLSGRSLLLAGAEGTVLESRDGGHRFTPVPRSDHSAITAAVALNGREVLLLGRGSPAVVSVGAP